MTTITAEDVHRMSHHDQQLMRHWLRSHGLDPDSTYSVTTIGPLVVARVYVVDDEGRIQKHPRRDEPWQRTRLLRRRYPMPTWLEAR